MKKFFYLIFFILLWAGKSNVFSQSVGAGNYNSLIQCSSGIPKGSGNNWDGQLGVGTYSSEVIPVAANGLTGITSLAGGRYHTVALKSDGTVWAYGYNNDGQLGDGTYNNSTTAVQVSGLTGITAIASGSYFALALKSDGTVWAWGRNWDGELGDGSFSSSNVPVQVSGLTGITAIGAGYYHGLAVKSPGTVWAWGANWSGQLGDGTYNTAGSPVQSTGLTGMVSVAGGYEHSLALKSNGTIWAFGYNGSGQLGDGTYNSINTPILVTGLTGITHIAAGAYHSLAIKSPGTVWGWGSNWNGQLGNGTTNNDYTTPIQTSGLANVISIAGGEEHSCAAKNDGSYLAWGYNGEGQLGDGTYDNQSIAVEMRDCCNGFPEIAMSDTCIIDTTELGNNSQTYFFIHNTACGTLNVTNISSSNPAFTVLPAAATISAYDSVLITVTYIPTILGNNTGTLTITNSANDTTMCLAGFCLQAPQITHSPATFSVSLGCGAVSTSTLTIGNIGPGTLNFNVAAEPSQSVSDFYDGFESGNISSWTNEGGSYVKQVVTGSPGSGTYSFKQTGGSNGWLDGISHSFPSSQPTSVSFKIKSESGNVGESNNVIIGQASDIGTNGPIGYVWIDNNSLTVNMYTGWSGTLSYPLATNTWHKIEFRNINYSTKKFDYYVDGNLLMTNISFENSNINSLDIIHLFSYENNTCYFDEIVFGHNPSTWLSTNPTGGTLVSGSTNIDVNFSAGTLAEGVYYGDVVVHSNDPNTPEVVVPCTLTVVGDPDIALPNGCPSFNTIMVGDSHQMDFQIDNQGCDTLHISNVTTSSGEFTIDAYLSVIPPYSSNTITVTFQPTVAASHTTSITVFNDDADEAFCLQGTAVSAPTFSVTPSSLNVSTACSQTVAATLTISNPGAADLTYSIPNFNPVSTCGASTGSNCCSYGITNVQFNTINNTSGNATLGYQDFTSINTIVQKSNTYTLSVVTGYNADYVNVWIDWNNNGTFEGSERVMNNLTSPTTNHTVVVTVPSTAVQNTPLRMRAVSSYYSNPPACGTVTYGQHEDYIVYVSKWLNITPPLSGTVTPTNSVNVPVIFNSAGLAVGTYTSSVTVNSNDPLLPSLQVPCTFSVTGTPDIDIPVSGCPSFNTLMVGSVDKDTFTISNLGCDTLLISNVTSSSPQFIINSFPAKISPFSTGKLIVWFQPTLAGSYTTTIDVFNNDVNQSLCFQGVAIPPATISITPSPITVSLGCCEKDTIPLNIENIGGSNLTYQITTNQNFTEGFENGLSKWVTGGPQGAIWGVQADPYTGSFSLSESPGGNYGNGWNMNITLAQPLQVTDPAGCNLSFWKKRFTECSYDYFHVQLSVNGGAYFNLQSWSCGSEPAWNQKNYSLTPYVSNGSMIKIRFLFTTDGSVTYQGVNIDDISITGIQTFPDWLTLISAGTGTLTPSANINDSLEFNSCGQTIGTYTCNILVSSNDPATPVDTIPVSFTVTGVAEDNYYLTDSTGTCLNLDSIMAYTTSRDTITIFNTGCDTLFVDSVKYSNIAYNSFFAADTIMPGDTGYVVVQFAPSFSVAVTTTVTGTATVYTNDTDPAICLHAEVFPHPIASVVPDTFNVLLNCSDTLRDTLTVYNTGQGSLIFSASSISGRSATFDGNADYINVPDNNSLDLPTTLTIETWVYINTIQETWTAIIGKPGRNYTLWLNNNRYMHLSYSGNSINTPVNSINMNQWHHVAATIDVGTAVMKIFIDGVEQASGPTFGNAAVSASPFIMGRNLDDGWGNFLNGKLDEVRVWNIARSQSQIQSTMNKSLAGSEYGLAAYWNFDNSNVIDQSQNSNNGSFSGNATTVIPNAPVIPAWLNYSFVTDTVAPGDSSNIPIEFTSTGLSDGNYSDSIVIASNDPLNDPITVPIYLTIEGDPVANFYLFDSLGTCLNMDSIMDFTTSSDTIAIFNSGCDTLFIDSVKYSNAVFSTVYAANYILPGDTNGVVVQFAPSYTVAGTTTVTGTVTVYTNDSDPVICLQGEVFPRPVQTHVQNSYSLTLQCNDTIVDTLILYNTGGSALTFHLTGGKLTPDVLLVAADDNGYMTDVKNKLLATGKFNSVDLFDANTGTPTLALLQNYDAAFVWSWYGISDANLLGDRLADYVDGGGAVVTGEFANYTAGGYQVLGRFSSDNYWCIPPSSYWSGAQSIGTVYDPTHPIMEDVTNFYGGSLSYRPSTGSVHPSATRIANWGDGRPLVATRIINGSRRVDLGMWPVSDDAYSGAWDPNSDGARLMANAIYWAVNGGVDWMTLSPLADTIDEGGNDSTIVELEFISTNHTIGTYTANVLISSNDPLNPVDTVFVTMELEGDPEANFVLLDSIGNCLDLDSIMELTTSVDTVLIFNTGCDTLKINSLVFSDPQFSAVYAANYILPGDTNGVIVQFLPAAATGTVTGTLTINTNDADPVICLYGEAFAKPEQCHDPNLFYEHFLVCQDSLLDTITICNTGAGDLNYMLWSPLGRSASFDGSGDWIYQSGSTGLPTGGSAFTVEAWIFPTAYNDVNYNGIISWGNRGCTGNGFALSIQNNGRPSMATWCNDFVPGTGAAATLDQWNHIACVVNGQSVTLYMNGTPVSTTLSNMPVFNSSWLSIGDLDYGGRYFSGKIDEVKVWNSARTQADIISNMARTLSGTEPGLTGYWNFDDSLATDLSPNTNNAFLNGNTFITHKNVEFLPAATGTVSPSGTYSVQVKFKKAGLAPGTHTFPIFLNSNDPLNNLDTINVTFDIDALPPSPTAGSNSPVCAGTNLSLTSSTISGATYAWTGPNSFTSTSQNPVITNASTAASGTYSVTASVSGCPQGAPGTTTVVVNPAPSVPIAGSNGTVCTGQTLSLTSSTISGGTYAWTGPNSFTSTLQNPLIAGVNTAAAGTYSVTATVPGCPPTAAGTTTVTINLTPAVPTANSNAPVCAGTDLSLTASTVGSATYSWTGPNSFTDATQNPVIAGISTAGSGTYSVTAIENGCSSAAGTTSVTVNPQPPVPTAGSNSTVCEGKTLSLTASTIPGATYAWTGPNSFTASLQNPTLGTISTAAAGTYSVTATVTGCPTTAAGTTTVVVNPTPVAPTASNTSPVCVGFDMTLSASTVGSSTYSWTGPASFTSTSQDPVIISIATNRAGTYSVTATELGCTSSAGTTTVVVNTPPAAPVTASNSPVCVGSNLSLTASTISGASYAWSGPNGFTDATQNPILTSVGTVNAGTYSVIATKNGCVGTAGTTTVIVNPPPAVPTAGNNGTICSGQTLSLTASSTGTTYSWTGPNSFTSTLQNPNIVSATTAGNGTYSVSAIVAGCPPSSPGTTSVTINQTPSAPSANSNTPVCAGTDLSLTANTISGATYSWSGPNSFTDAVQNPVITGISVAGSGSYSVSATVAGCTGPIGTTSVTVNPAPSAPTATNNSTLCSGQTLNLNATFIAGAAYSWTGPNSFTSTAQNPSIAGVSTAANGTYSVTATVPGCPTTGAGTTPVTINQTPVAPTANSNSPVCVGSDISLTASTITGVTYAWTGPNSFTGATQNPVIGSALTTMSGTYSVNATENGCTGPNGTTLVTVNPPPGIPVAGSNGTICAGQNISLMASSISGASYSWSGPGTYTASAQNPTITGANTSNAGTYSVNATVPGCPVSGTGTTTVVVNPSPAAPVANFSAPVCSGTTLSLSASTVGSSTYAWSGPLAFTSTSQNPTVAGVSTTNAGTYSVSATENGCPGPAGTVSVTINQTPGAPSITGNSTVCSGQTLSLNASSISGVTYAWNGPNSFTANTQNMSIAGITTSDAGTYSVAATNSGCAGPVGTVTVAINATPSAPTASGSTPICSGQTLTLSAGTVAGATYTWTGPNSFTNTAQNPTIPNITTSGNGTYSVSAVVSGCGSSASTASVVVNETPSAPSASNNSPVCVGSAFTLSAGTISGASYTWNGPNSYTDASQDPVIGSAATTHGGTYSVTATVTGCTGPASTTSVTINIPPSVPTAGNGSTICSGQTLSLTASTVSGATYSWTGPNSFTSTLQDPTIVAASSAASGTYSVTATTAGCPPSAAGTTIETVNQTPSAPVASANNPVCVGFTLSLTASSGGTAYSWTGPSGFTSPAQNPTLASVTTANAGTYSVTATTLGCTGPAGTTSVVVNTIPAAPTTSNQSACFGGTIPDLTATGSNIEWWSDAGLTTLAGSGSPFATGQTAANTYTYYATQTVNGCRSLSSVATLTINALPATPNAGSDVTVCYGNPVPDLTATGSNITWYNSLGAPVGTGSPFATGETAPGSYTFTATQTNTVTTCESLGDAVVLNITSIPPPVAPDVAVCAGNPVPPLVATGTNIQWYNSSQVLMFSGSPFNTGLTAVGTYTFYVTQTNTVTTCSSVKDTVLLIISTQPTAAPTVADQAACFGTTVPDLVATSGTIINWFSDAGLTNELFSGNPFATGLTSPGSYTFFATDSTPGCGNGPAEPVVLTIHSLPATLSVNDTANCFGSSTPNLITNGTNIQWYNNLLAVVSVNDTFATGQTAIGTYTYYVTQTSTVTACESLKDTVHLTIHALPATPAALDTAICSAATIPNLTSTGTNVQWYDTSGTFVFTGNSYNTGHTTPGLYSYLVTQKDAITGCESVPDTAVLAILLSPPVPVANNVAVCSGNPIPALTSTGINPQWYSNAALTNWVHAGNTFNTGQTLVGVYTYYVKDSLSGCVSSSADSVTLTINATPAKPVANDVTICYGGSSVLTSTGTNAHWFSDVTLINQVGTGNAFNTGVTTAGTYTYYVTDFAPGCGNSPSDTVLLTINPNPLVTVNTYTTTIIQGNSTPLNAYNAATFAWAPPAGLSATTGASVISSPTVTTTYTVTGTNSYGCSSSVSILIIVNPLGVASITDPVQDVSIYPNPAIGSFTLEFNTTLETPIDIYMLNMLGDRVRVMEAGATQGGGLMKHKYKIDTNTLTEGVYNIEIVTEQGTVNRRVVLFR